MRKLVTFYWLLYAIIITLAIFSRSPLASSVPPSLYWEEVALGYDAYSLAITGKDHHGNGWPLVAIESFGDWKPAGYIYWIIPFIQLFGLHDWAVRAPSLLAGVAIVVGVGELAVLIYQLGNKPSLLKSIKNWWFDYHPENWYRLSGVFIAAISPWAIHFSRAAWEVNLATAYILWAVILFLKSGLTKTNTNDQTLFLKRIDWLVVFSVILLVCSMYTYHAARLIAPIMGLLLLLWWLWKNDMLVVSRLQQKWQAKTVQVTTLGIISLMGIVALMPFIFANEEMVSSRFSQTSIFSDITIIEESNELKQASGDSFLSTIFYHRYVLFFREILTNFLSHFNLNFLFISGESNPRHSFGYMGQLYYLDFILIIVGVASVIRGGQQRYMLGAWLIVGILPAALTLATPHALRILPVLPVFLVIISVGLVQITQSLIDIGKRIFPAVLKNNFPVYITATLVCLYSIQFGIFWHFYTRVYAPVEAEHWQYGYKQMVQAVDNLKQENPNYTVHISRAYGRPAMYYWYYSKSDPRLVQAEEKTALKDQGEFLQFENITFGDYFPNVASPAIVVGPPTEIEELIANNHSGKSITEKQKIMSLDTKDVVWSINVIE